ncbi:GH23967 [Drosophila grimshawi]|uniref:GH23967 n=1 Tax=Drosophila grimshawi TaxID=7222 RepID=B4JZN3_DROGR|nr:GH23967 [Drosophila grimshawi]
MQLNSKSLWSPNAPPDHRPTSEKDTKESLPRREEPHQESAMDEQAPPDSRLTSETDTKKSLPRREEPHQDSAMDEQEYPDSRRTTQGRSTRDPIIAGMHLEQSAAPPHTGVVGE